MTKIRGMMVVALMGLMVSTGSLMAHRGGGPGGPGGPDGMMRHLRGLDLTDAQKEQIRGLVEEFRADHADEFEQMKALHEQMRTQRQDGDREAAKATMQQMKELRESMKADHEALREAILGVLTTEQKAKLEEGKEKCRGERKGRHGEGEIHAERNGGADID